jgi:hypothetical protein
MNTIEALKAACIEASEAAARIQARVTDKLLERARTQGLTDAEAFDFAEAWMHQMALLAKPSMALSGSMAISTSAAGEATAQQEPSEDILRSYQPGKSSDGHNRSVENRAPCSITGSRAHRCWGQGQAAEACPQAGHDRRA